MKSGMELQFRICDHLSFSAAQVVVNKCSAIHLSDSIAAFSQVDNTMSACN
jgi:hypothetical protein